jgi:tRNA 2-thiocytidine biosynthesis protein TtcA
MLADGDRVMVGLSGGKDSWALLQILDVLRQRAPINFSLVAVNVDSGYKEYKHDVIARTCEARGWEYRIEHTGIGEVIEDILDADQTPCSLCARLRRGCVVPNRGRSGREQDRARPSRRRLHRDAAAESLLRGFPQGDAGQAGFRRWTALW